MLGTNGAFSLFPDYGIIIYNIHAVVFGSLTISLYGDFCALLKCNVALFLCVCSNEYSDYIIHCEMYRIQGVKVNTSLFAIPMPIAYCEKRDMLWSNECVLYYSLINK